MVKAVNKLVLEINNTENEYFEKAIFYIRPEMSCNSKLRPVPPEVLEETWSNYQPGTRRPYGLMEWPGLLRKLERMDPSFRS